MRVHRMLRGGGEFQLSRWVEGERGEELKPGEIGLFV
jgi:hypothetical protein